jgi:RNA 3'-phosphate cyclase
MMNIDGSYLEGGGQILRTSLSLSAITNIPFRIENIRKKRSRPGLAIQHLQSARAVAQLTNTKVRAKKGDTFLEFSPSSLLDGGELEIEIHTAGSTSLLISTIFPIACKLKKPLKIKIHGGGTWNKWAPSVLYLEKVLLPILSKAGFKAEIKIFENGFVPWGGAELELIVFPWKEKKELLLTECGVKEVFVDSVASKSLKGKSVAERQLSSSKKILSGLSVPVKENAEYIEGEYYGSGVLIYSSPTILGWDVVGERGKPAEKVGKEAASGFLSSVKEKAGVDCFAADQLMVYLALAGGKIKTNKISSHARTNAYTIEKFLDVKFKIKEDGIIECERGLTS